MLVSNNLEISFSTKSSYNVAVTLHSIWEFMSTYHVRPFVSDVPDEHLFARHVLVNDGLSGAGGQQLVPELGKEGVHGVGLNGGVRSADFVSGRI